MYISQDDLPPDLSQLMGDIDRVAQARAGHCLHLLQLLRLLEEMHRSIHDGLFRAALPSTRQDLYTLLQDIEEAGEWPYLPRLQIRALLHNLAVHGFASESQPSANSQSYQPLADLEDPDRQEEVTDREDSDPSAPVSSAG
jgi:hypothetical protein